MLREFAAKDNREVRDLTPDALNVLMQYNWPGNVRELRNTIERMVVLARGDRLSVRDVPPGIRQAVEAKGLPAGVALAPAAGVRPLEEAEKIMILNALRKCDGNKTRAAQELGISRRTLHRKLNQYKVEDLPPGERPAGGDPQ
jgi:DNA-binding NtrC family response regulator